MMRGFPELMADLLAFLEKECPTILVHETVKDDFDADVLFPPAGYPTEEQVNKSALNICMRLLAQSAEMPAEVCASPPDADAFKFPAGSPPALAETL